MKVAFITGASRGIGRAVAIGLAEEGFSLALAARDEEALESLKDSLARSEGQKHLVCPLDVCKAESVESAVQNCEDSLGPISLVFNNAGIHKDGLIELSPDELQEIFAINVFGAVNVLRATLPKMKSRKSGSVYNLASRAGTIAFSGKGAYCATKSALRAINESILKEYASDGLRITSINPSWVDTDMAQEAGCRFKGEEMVQPEDVLKTILYLESLSSEACVQDVTIYCRSAVA